MDENEYIKRVEDAKKEYDKLEGISRQKYETYKKIEIEIQSRMQQEWDNLATNLANLESELKSIKEPAFKEFREINDKMAHLRDIFEDGHTCNNCGEPIND